MTFELLHHTPGCRRLILIFTGWSTAPELYYNLYKRDWDIAVVHDYSSLDFDIQKINDYSTVVLFAWSLGVVAASAAIPPNLITDAYALNGSLNPVDDSEGIPVEIYEGTYRSLDAINLRKFRRRMSPDAKTFRAIFDSEFTNDEIKSLQNQLAILRKASEKLTYRLPWRKAFVSNNDRIFPPDNLICSWKKRNVETIILDGAHFYPLQNIIDFIIPDTEIIARKFASSLKNYDEHAMVQKKVAERLAEILNNKFINNGCDILEIGVGTGMMTKLYSRNISPASIDFVELFPVNPFNIAPVENYYEDNGETYLDNCDKKYDLIISTSTIQWFTDIPSFIFKCKAHLKPGGILALSTFTKGNLLELDKFRPSPLQYHTENEYREWITNEFKDYTIEKDEIALNFSSKRELLMHLKYTGVNAAGKISTSPLSLPDSLRSLTYHPLLIIASI